MRCNVFSSSAPLARAALFLTKRVRSIAKYNSPVRKCTIEAWGGGCFSSFLRGKEEIFIPFHFQKFSSSLLLSSSPSLLLSFSPPLLLFSVTNESKLSNYPSFNYSSSNRRNETLENAHPAFILFSAQRKNKKIRGKISRWIRR